jgi:galactokinase
MPACAAASWTSSSLHGRPDHALLLDTRTLEMEWLPLPEGVAIVVCNTMTKHALAGSAYNERRADCEAGVRAIAAQAPQVRALRDVTPAILEATRDALARGCIAAAATSSPRTRG